MDVQELQRRLEAVETAVAGNRGTERRLAFELDRLAEHMIGETAPELQRYKQRIQTLIIQLAPNGHAVDQVEVYIETYCHHR